MRTRELLALAGVLTLAVAAAPATDPDPYDFQPPEAEGMTWVAADHAGDWGEDVVGPEGSIAGHALGQDLTSAWVLAEEDQVEFLLQVTYLPTDPGGVPEGTRYTWNLTVDGVPLELDGKWSNLSRGACDPTSGQCDPQSGKLPRVPEERMFTLRGLCYEEPTPATTLTLCQELAVVQATFRPASGTIGIAIPAESLLPAIDAGREAAGLDPLPEGTTTLPPCTEIGPGTNLFGGSISAAPSAYFTSSAMPLDTMFVGGTVVVPGDCDA